MRLSELLHKISSIAEEKGISTPVVVGGVPRDRVLGKTNDLTDLDITTGDQGIHYLAKECAMALQSPLTNYMVMPDGHAKIDIGDFKLDFSSNFKIPDIDTILTKIGKPNPSEMQMELFSRDFTCNTLLMTLDLKTISDPTSKGIKDIKNRMIRTCLDPELTLGYDNKRIIRVIYLAAKLNFQVDEAIMQWIRKHPEAIKNCRHHSLVKKLNQAMSYDADLTVKLLDQLNLWPHIPIIPELTPYMTHLGRL